MVYVAWEDFRPRLSTSQAIVINHSGDGGSTFGPNVRVTTVSVDVPPLNPNFAPVVADCYMGDYNGLAADPTTVYGTWGDNRDPVSTRPDPNVFFRKVVVR